MPIDPIRTDHAPEAIGPYSQAVRAGNLVFCSGQIALDPSTGEMVPGDVVAQARQVLTNLTAVLSAAGTSAENVVRCTVYLKSMDDFPRVNDVYAEFFPAPSPSRATVEAARLPKDALVEIDAIAVID